MQWFETVLQCVSVRDAVFRSVLEHTTLTRFQSQYDQISPEQIKCRLVSGFSMLV